MMSSDIKNSQPVHRKSAFEWPNQFNDDFLKAYQLQRSLNEEYKFNSKDESRDSTKYVINR